MVELSVEREIGQYGLSVKIHAIDKIALKLRIRDSKIRKVDSIDGH